jgi:hypothetical protein
MSFNEREIALILSTLESDKLGKWGDERSENIAKLIRKIKRERVRA